MLIEGEKSSLLQLLTTLSQTKMADNDIVEELTVEHGKRTLVASAFERIRLLFHVLVHFSSPEESAVKSGIQWLALKGEKEAVTQAKVCRNISFKVCCFMALKVFPYAILG